jgi:prepilin-type processing-associated H-X9-DG protein
MPALQKARRSANLLQCASNLRQVGLAIHSYAGANRGVLPYAAMKVSTPVPSPSGGTGVWCVTWDDLISEYLGANLTSAEKEAQFNTKGIAALKCPSDPIDAIYTTAGVHRRSYALVRALKYNPRDGRDFSGIAAQWSVSALSTYTPNPKYQIKLTQLRAPARTLMAVERHHAWNVQGYDNEAYVDRPAQVSQLDLFSSDPLTPDNARRTFHGARWNFLFADGHVDSLMLEETVRTTAGGVPDFTTATGIWTREAYD